MYTSAHGNGFFRFYRPGFCAGNCEKFAAEKVEGSFDREPHLTTLIKNSVITVRNSFR